MTSRGVKKPKRWTKRQERIYEAVFAAAFVKHYAEALASRFYYPGEYAVNEAAHWGIEAVVKMTEATL